MDYSGTITQVLLAGRVLIGETEVRAALAEFGIGMSGPLGFNNTYVLGMKKGLADRLNIRTISDLKKHPDETVLIKGHSDNSGDREWNRELSLSRARSVRNYLAAVGIDADPGDAGVGVEAGDHRVLVCWQVGRRCGLA